MTNSWSDIATCNPNGEGHILFPRVDYEGVNIKSIIMQPRYHDLSVPAL